MEQQAVHALERINNPILVILLIALMVACVTLWMAYRNAQSKVMDALLTNISAMGNLNSTLANMKERLDEIEDHISPKS